jgi:hypothetical protein
MFQSWLEAQSETFTPADPAPIEIRTYAKAS